jgi:hypothetical protein
LLRDVSTRGLGQSTVFVEFDDLADPDSCRVVGHYRVERDQIKMTVRVRRGDRQVDEVKLSGAKDDLRGLAKQIVEAARRSVISVLASDSD